MPPDPKVFLLLYLPWKVYPSSYLQIIINIFTDDLSIEFSCILVVGDQRIQCVFNHQVYLCVMSWMVNRKGSFGPIIIISKGVLGSGITFAKIRYLACLSIFQAYLIILKGARSIVDKYLHAIEIVNIITINFLKGHIAVRVNLTLNIYRLDGEINLPSFNVSAGQTQGEDYN